MRMRLGQLQLFAGVAALLSRIVFGAYEQCGSVLTGEGDLQSHGFPREYPSRYSCDWTIEAGPEDKVDLVFEHFDVEQSENCVYDYLQIFAMSYAPKFCGRGIQKISRTGTLSVTGSVKLAFKSDEADNFKGFSMKYTVTPKATEAPPTTPPQEEEKPISCADEPCENGGECLDVDEGEVFCFCEDGFEGDFCEINVDECASTPCENDGTCTDGSNSVTCECPPGFIGEFCSVDVDECIGDPCKNGGTCVDGANSFECECVSGYTGWNCAQEIDECESGPCLNMGVCENMVGYYECVCFPGYTGVNCEISPPTEPPTEPPTTPTLEMTTTTSSTTAPQATTAAQPAHAPTPVLTTTTTHRPLLTTVPSREEETQKPVEMEDSIDIDTTVIPTTLHDAEIFGRSTTAATSSTPHSNSTNGAVDGTGEEEKAGVSDKINESDGRTTQNDVDPFLVAGVILAVLAAIGLLLLAIRYKMLKDKAKVKPVKEASTTSDMTEIKSQNGNHVSSDATKKLEITDDLFAGT